MNKKTAWILTCLWMGLIFYLSSQVATESNELSTGITVIIKRLIDQVLPSLDITTEVFNHFLRKTAHFTIYLILGLLLKNAFNYENLSILKGNIYPLIVGILYAMSDEFHQSFVPNRGPQISDVVIDSLGIIVGIILLNLLVTLKTKYYKREKYLQNQR